jgi:hypothetical protein
MSEHVMIPDGYGLMPEAMAFVAKRDHPIHLRLSSVDQRAHPRPACERGMGGWWSGVVDEVTCLDCLAAHAGARHGGHPTPPTDHAATPTSERGA